MLTKLILALVACPFALSFAHTQGHGSKIEGIGPNGGNLAAVVSASESEFGSKAKTKAIAEWKRIDANTFEIFLWNEKRDQTIHSKLGGEAKWIVLGTEKPFVVTSKIEGLTLKHKFEAENLKTAKTIEVILPNLGKVDKKHVFVMNL